MKLWFFTLYLVGIDLRCSIRNLISQGMLKTGFFVTINWSLNLKDENLFWAHFKSPISGSLRYFSLFGLSAEFRHTRDEHNKDPPQSSFLSVSVVTITVRSGDWKHQWNNFGWTFFARSSNIKVFLVLISYFVNKHLWITFSIFQVSVINSFVILILRKILTSYIATYILFIFLLLLLLERQMVSPVSLINAAVRCRSVRQP